MFPDVSVDISVRHGFKFSRGSSVLVYKIGQSDIWLHFLLHYCHIRNIHQWVFFVNTQNISEKQSKNLILLFVNLIFDSNLIRD